MNRYGISAYSPYGFAAEIRFAHTSLGFNGEYAQALTWRYILGSGYRAFDTCLMRFLSPDSLSPFAAGGINTYAYCSNDPVNRSDPTGHSFLYPANYVPRPIIKLPRRGPELTLPTPPPLLAKRHFSSNQLKDMSYAENQYLLRVSKTELNKAKLKILGHPDDALEATKDYVSIENRQHGLTKALNAKITDRYAHVIEQMMSEQLYRPKIRVRPNSELAKLIRDGMTLSIPNAHDMRTITPPY